MSHYANSKNVGEKVNELEHELIKQKSATRIKSIDEIEDVDTA